MVVGSTSTHKNVLFSFLHPGKNTKHGVELRHLMPNVSKIWRKMGNGNVLAKSGLKNIPPSWN